MITTKTKKQLHKIKEIIISHGLSIISVSKSKFILALEDNEVIDSIKANAASLGIKDVLGHIRNNIKTYIINIPIMINDVELLYGSFIIPNTVLGLLSTTIPKYGKFTPAEALYVARNKRWDIMQENNGGWKHIGPKLDMLKGRIDVDDGYYVRLSDTVSIELERGLRLDMRKFHQPGFAGFSATNGILSHLVGKYSKIGGRRISENILWNSRVIFNVEYHKDDISTYLDMTAVPQDVTATTQVVLKNAVRVSDSSSLEFYKHSPLINRETSKLSSSIPYNKMMSSQRMMVVRARYQHIPLLTSEVPLVRKKGGFDISGKNALTVRSSIAPIDSFIVSDEFVNEMIGIDKIELQFSIPKHAHVVYHFSIPSEQEVTIGLNLQTINNTISKNGKLLTYYRIKNQWSKKIESTITDEEKVLQFLQNNLSAEKDAISVRSKIPVYPYKVRTYDFDGNSNISGTKIVISCYRITRLKVGTKLIDRYGNKGTVCEIRPANLMPLVHLPVDAGPVNAHIVYNPSIWRKKIGFSMKLEELVSLKQFQNIFNETNNKDYLYANDDSTASAMSQVRDIPRLLDVMIDGHTAKMPAGFHFIHHLNHDPIDKFKVVTQNSIKEGCRYSFIDKIHYTKLDIKNLTNDLSRANEIARSIGIKITKGVNDIPITSIDKLSYDDIKTTIPVTKKLDRKTMYQEIHTLSTSSIENTVCDYRFWENNAYGVISTMYGNVYIPPKLLKPIIRHDNSLVVGDELIAANAILCEQASVNWCESSIERDTKYLKSILSQQQNTNTIGIVSRVRERISRIQKRKEYSQQKLKNLIRSYKVQISYRLCKELRDFYFPRRKGIRGVAVASPSLDIDTVAIPQETFKQMFSKRKNHIAFLRRHPIHRVFNSPIVKIVPSKYNNVIEVNPKTIKLLDGDFDGDEVEIMLTDLPYDKYKSYFPSILLKGWDDIDGKKIVVRRSAPSAKVGHSQKMLKMCTAIAGSIARDLAEASMHMDNFGFAAVCQVYHFMGQTALNAKHNSDSKLLRMIQRIRQYMIYGKYSNANKLIIQFMGWDTKTDSLSKKRSRRITALMGQLIPVDDLKMKNAGLIIARKSMQIPTQILNDIAQIDSDVGDTWNIAQQSASNSGVPNLS